MSFRAERRVLALFIFALGCSGAVAQTPPAPAAASHNQDTRAQMGKLPSAADLRPTGPVNITARRAELVQGDSAVYIGNVVLDSNTVKMDGDRLDLKQHPNGQYDAKIVGTPGHLSHNGTGPDDPSVSAHAKTLIYNSETGIVDLLGDAFFKRGDDQITGEEIHYNLAARSVQASGGDDRVHIILQPPPPQQPAPAAPNGSAAQPAPPPAAPTSQLPAPATPPTP